MNQFCAFSLGNEHFFLFVFFTFQNFYANPHNHSSGTTLAVDNIFFQGGRKWRHQQQRYPYTACICFIKEEEFSNIGSSGKKTTAVKRSIAQTVG